MPKYKDKMRLKQLIAKQGAVDDFTRWLVLAGYDDRVVARGLEFFVEWWEEIIEWYKNALHTEKGCLGLVVEEFDYDLYVRMQLYQAICNAPPEEIDRLQTRIDAADLIFRQMTLETGVGSAWVEQHDRVQHWWIFRIPVYGLG